MRIPLAFAAFIFVQGAHAQSLDSFLGSIGPECFTGKGFDAFFRSVGKQLNEESPPSNLTLVLPLELIKYFDQPILERGPEYYKASFQLKGLTYAGMPVYRIELAVGVGTGINVTSVGFNTSLTSVRKVFEKKRQELAKLQKKLEGSDIIGQITFNEINGKGEVVCDGST